MKKFLKRLLVFVPSYIMQQIDNIAWLLFGVYLMDTPFFKLVKWAEK